MMTVFRLSRHASPPVALAAALLLAFGCSEPTGPAEPFTVSIRTSTVFGPVINGNVQPAQIRCGFRMIASATGKGRADWEGGVLRFYAGYERSEPVDTISLTEEELRGAWALDSIYSSRADTTEWDFTAVIPFEVELAFQYRQRGQAEPSLATGRARCGPVPLEANGPTTTNLVQVRTSDPDLNVGDTVFVTYAANSANGLWQSGVSISGPFEATAMRNDTLLTTVQRTLAFRVPPRSRLDLPISVLLIADDIALERRTDLHATDVRVHDRTAPVSTGYAPPQEVASGGSVGFTVRATDDNGIRSIVWELDGTVARSDSIVLPELATDFELAITLTVPPEWAGMTTRLRVRAYDEAGLASAEFVGPDQQRFHEGFTEPIATVTLPGLATSVVDRARMLHYGSLTDQGRIVVTDLATLSEASQFSIPSPSALALTRTGDSLLVSIPDSRTIRIVRTSSGAILSTFTLTALDSIVAPGTSTYIAPDWMAVTSGGRALIHLGWLRGLVEVDLATGAQRYLREFEEPLGGFTGELSPDGRRLMIVGGQCFRWYVVASDSLGPCVPRQPLNGFGIYFGPFDDRIGVGGRILDADFQVLGLPGPAGRSWPAADGVHHWTMGDGRLFKVRTADGVVVKSMALPLGAIGRSHWLGTGPMLVFDAHNGFQRIDLTGR